MHHRGSPTRWFRQLGVCASAWLTACLLPDAVLDQSVGTEMPDGQGGAAAQQKPAPAPPRSTASNSSPSSASSAEAPPVPSRSANEAAVPDSMTQASPDGGTSPDSEAEPLLPDAGAPPSPSSLEAACSATQSTLEPGTRTCLFFAAAARVTWQAAALACQTRESVLVSIKDSERNQLLGDLIGSTDIWTGGNDPGTNPGANEFVWRDNTPVSLLLGTWAAGEPDAVADQFCLTMTGEAANPPDPAHPWRDRPCDELKAYVCEQEL